MSKSPIFVLIEVEGEVSTMAKVYPGDSYIATLDVTVEPGTYLNGCVRSRRIRLSVPQEGVKPLPPPPWMDDHE